MTSVKMCEETLLLKLKKNKNIYLKMKFIRRTIVDKKLLRENIFIELLK